MSTEKRKTRKSKIPEGFSSMGERPADRDIYKPMKITMVWTQNRKPPEQA